MEWSGVEGEEKRCLMRKNNVFPPFEDHQCPASYCLHTLELLFHEPFLGEPMLGRQAAIP